MKGDAQPTMPSGRTSKALVYAATALGAALLLMVEARTFLLIMDSRVNINEHVYLAASFLYQHYSLYKEFAFPQMPYMPVLYGTIFKITGTPHYLLTGRILTFLFANLGAAAVFLIALRYTKSTAAGIMLAMLFLFNPAISSAMQECSNYMAPIPFALFGLYCFTEAMPGAGRRRLLLFASGALISIATGFKLFYAFMVVPAYIAVVFYPGFGGWRTRLRMAFAPFTLGLLAGSGIPIYYLITELGPFMYNNLYTNLNREYFAELGFNSHPLFMDRVHYLVNPHGNLELFAAALVATLAGTAGAIAFRKKSRDSSFVFALATLTAALSFSPLYFTTCVFVQYVAMPAAFAVALIAYAWDRLRSLHNAYLIAALLLFTGFELHGELSNLFELRDLPWRYEDWAVTKFRRDAQAVKSISRKLTDNNLMATPFPLHALEGGFDFYREFSQGPFLYAIGDLVKKSGKYNEPVYTTPTEVQAFLQKNPPGEILLENYMRMGPIKEFAERNGYQRIVFKGQSHVFETAMILYVKPYKNR